VVVKNYQKKGACFTKTNIAVMSFRQIVLRQKGGKKNVSTNTRKWFIRIFLVRLSSNPTMKNVLIAMQLFKEG